MAAALKSTQYLKPRNEHVVAALDVGSSKVATIIAGFDGENPPHVLGTSLRANIGMKRGLVADMEKTEKVIRAAVMQAEKAAGIEIDSVIVNISAGQLASDITTVEIDIAGQQISEADIHTLLSQGRMRIEDAFSQAGRTILHAEPTLYMVDGVDGVNNPLGFHADRLSVDIHVLTAATPPCRNLDLAIRNAHLDVKTIIASGIATSIAVLNPEERELGVAVVEIGAGITTVAVHGGGMLVGLASIPMGAADITADIASAFTTRRAAAERLKVLSGAATASPRDNHDMIEIPTLDEDDGQDNRRLPRAELISVIRSRLERIFAEVETALKDIGFTGPAGRQIVLTGGGAEMRGIADHAQSVLGRNVRIGRPRGITGLPDPHATAAFSTLAGLILYGVRAGPDLTRIPYRSARGGRHAPRSRSTLARLFDQLKRKI